MGIGKFDCTDANCGTNEAYATCDTSSKPSYVQPVAQDTSFHLDITFCPDGRTAWDRTCCCGSQICNGPGPSPTPTPPPMPPSPSPAPSAGASCKAHSGCAGLDGDCCPASNGVMLACCGSSPAPPPTPPSSGASCKAHSACAALDGDCCPATNGVMLACCNQAEVLHV